MQNYLQSFDPPTYDPHDGEGDKEDGWTKCIVCQAFTINPETGKCIHWDKDIEHHEVWCGDADDDDDELGRWDE